MSFTTPSGFRDVVGNEALRREAITRAVQDLFAAHGFEPIETPTLEFMDVMKAGGRPPASPFKFFDSAGDLLAMRPDVTLQVARAWGSRYKQQQEPLRLRYTQRVFRETDFDSAAPAREVTQMGIECIGEEGAQADSEIISLFCEGLQVAGVTGFTVALATVGVLRALLRRSGAPVAWQEAVLKAFHESNFVALDTLTNLGPDLTIEWQGTAPAYAEAIRALPRIRGGKEAIAQVRALVAPLGCEEGLDQFEETYDALEQAQLPVHLLVDFSVMSSFDYYTGMVFEAYDARLGAPLGSGGRYDTMLGAFGAPRPAAGFAFTVEQALAAACEPPLADAEPRPLRIAVPKGSLNKDAIEALAAVGLDVDGLEHPGRQLIISRPGVDYIIVRPSDAPMFVALGAADCGICGKDSLLEADLDVVELADLGFGACRFVVAQPKGSASLVEEHYRQLGSLRIATKYPRIAKAHYQKTGIQVEIVSLHGNIELAPLTGLADRIIDITATGTTLRENNLEIVEDVLSSSARFFANPCALRTDPRIMEVTSKLVQHASEMDYEPIAGATG